MENVTNVFKLRLKELRGEKSQIEVAKALNISRSALSYYESGERTPDINVLYSMAQYFDVTADYLLGLTDMKKPDIEKAAIAKKTGLSERSIDVLQVLKETSGATGSTATDDFLYRFLELQAINLLIGGSWDILDNITNFLFLEFTHFSSFNDDNAMCLPISDLELYDSRLKITFSEDHDFYSKAFLFSLQHDLQSLRQKFFENFHKIFNDSVSTDLTATEMYEKLNLFFAQLDL